MRQPCGTLLSLESYVQSGALQNVSALERQKLQRHRTRRDIIWAHLVWSKPNRGLQRQKWEGYKRNVGSGHPLLDKDTSIMQWYILKHHEYMNARFTFSIELEKIELGVFWFSMLTVHEWVRSNMMPTNATPNTPGMAPTVFVMPCTQHSSLLF